MLLLLRLSLLPLPLPPTHYGLSPPSPSPKPLSLRFPHRSTFPLNPDLPFVPRSPWRRGPGSPPPARGSDALAACDEEAEGEFDEELARLLVLLPEEMRRKVEDHPERRHLVEIVMDLGRRPLARLPSGDFLLSDRPITSQDLHHATSQVGDFATDNRAGISRTLHRISAIRNRKGAIIGLTCRVGRAVSGSANLLRDLVKDGGSLLLIGPPGVGKTTIIRDIARTLADDYRKRVMIVDTSNEIGGDGDIPHAGIGSARRMQVLNSDVQHKVLIEAIENHMPQVIVIDEIGTKLEAMAASTIAQRGIQLVATAHGITIENLVMNPSLEMLVGGIQSVTLGDEEANRRGVQKTVLERKGPSTFTCGAEIISKTEVRVHHSLEATVDALLAGRSANFEVWKINPNGSTHGMSDSLSLDEDEIIVEDHLVRNDGKISDTAGNLEFAEKLVERSCEATVVIQLYVYGISETSVLQAIKQLEMDGMIILTDNISQAHVFLALHSKLKKNSQIQAVVKSHGIPIYVTKTSSVVQITKAVRALVKEHANGFEGTEENRASSSEETEALEEARLAIEQVVIPRRESVQLLPRPPQIISAQMGLIDKYNLDSEKIGREPDDTCLRILPLQADVAESSFADRLVDTSGELEDLNSCDGISGTQNGIARLPLLPE